jgi:Hydantoinase B/oxoprolinase
MVARPNAALAQIHSQIMWSRLIAVVEEQAQTMLRTAFSTSVREAGDLSAGVFDRHGRMLAQAVTGTPGHVNSMANAVRHFLDVYPLATMKPGDHYITNDPWLTSGHLHDITVADAELLSRRSRRPVRQHDPCGRHRRAGDGSRRTAGLRGGPVHSDHAARPRGAHE